MPGPGGGPGGPPDHPGTFIVIPLNGPNAAASTLKSALDAAVAQGYDYDSLTLNDNFAILYRKL